MSLQFQMGRKYKFYASKVSLREKKELLLLSETIYESIFSLPSISTELVDTTKSAVAAFISALYHDLGMS